MSDHHQPIDRTPFVWEPKEIRFQLSDAEIFSAHPAKLARYIYHNGDTLYIDFAENSKEDGTGCIKSFAVYKDANLTFFEVSGPSFGKSHHLATIMEIFNKFIEPLQELWGKDMLNTPVFFS